MPSLFELGTLTLVQSRQDRPLRFRVSARNLNTAGFGNAGEGRGIPVNAPYTPIENFRVTSVDEDSVVLGWNTPTFGLVTQYRIRLCVADDYCIGGKWRVASMCSPLCVCNDDGTPTCADGTEAECQVMQLSNVACEHHRVLACMHVQSAQRLCTTI
jgi:hypothetical protein